MNQNKLFFALFVAVIFFASPAQTFGQTKNKVTVKVAKLSEHKRRFNFNRAVFSNNDQGERLANCILDQGLSGVYVEVGEDVVEVELPEDLVWDLKKETQVIAAFSKVLKRPVRRISP